MFQKSNDNMREVQLSFNFGPDEKKNKKAYKASIKKRNAERRSRARLLRAIEAYFKRWGVSSI